MDILEILAQVNPSMWVFLGVLITAILAYYSTRNKNKNEGVISLAEVAVSLMEQYRLANEECQTELEECRKALKKRRKRRKR